MCVCVCACACGKGLCSVRACNRVRAHPGAFVYPVRPLDAGPYAPTRPTLTPTLMTSYVLMQSRRPFPSTDNSTVLLLCYVSKANSLALMQANQQQSHDAAPAALPATSPNVPTAAATIRTSSHDAAPAALPATSLCASPAAAHAPGIGAEGE
jgi:hypothetical protein